MLQQCGSLNIITKLLFICICIVIGFPLLFRVEKMWVSDISDNSEQSRCPLHASDQRYVIDWFWPMAFMKNFVWIFFFQISRWAKADKELLSQEICFNWYSLSQVQRIYCYQDKHVVFLNQSQHIQCSHGNVLLSTW